MYKFLTINTAINKVNNTGVCLRGFDPCGSSSGDRINSSESNTIVIESLCG
jgi:hypothetical protein